MSGINCCIPNLVCMDMGPSPVRLPTLVGLVQKVSYNELCTLVTLCSEVLLLDNVDGAMVGECLMKFRYWPTLKAG